MDITKDNNIEPENKPENKPALSVSQKNVEPISYFKEDEVFVFIYKKTEKLATALYMVTNLFSDNEPMKWTLRKKVSDLLSVSLQYKDTFSSSRADFVYDAKTRVLELVSLLEISHKAGLVSEMNFVILKQEFLHLISSVDASQNNGGELGREIIPKNFFDTQKDMPKEPAKPALSFSYSQHIYPSHAEHSTIVRDRKTDKDSTQDALVIKRSNRQNTILALLKKKGNLTIKDMSLVIKDCSEKTIQRELNSFIMNGVLKRTGERRWSRYSLA